MKRAILDIELTGNVFYCGNLPQIPSNFIDAPVQWECCIFHSFYRCKFCPRVFTVSNSLRTHTQRNHKEELEMSKRIENLAQNAVNEQR